MKILIERRSLQGEAHLENEEVKGLRLRTFLGLLDTAGESVSVAWTEGTILSKTLEGVDVFVIPTKIGNYTGGERDALDAFLGAGGGIWHLSNHKPLHEADAQLARTFGIRLEGTFYRTPGRLTRIEGADLKPHPILQGLPGEAEIRALVTNTTCALKCDTGRPIALLPSTMREKTSRQAPAGGFFALAFDGRGGAWPGRRGRLVTVADSGFLGDKESKVPGPGLIEEGDNRVFILRVVRWLGVSNADL